MDSGIGARVREARIRRGLTMAELARGTGLSPGAISRIEAGERVPGGGTVARLAGALGVDSGQLLSGDGGFLPARGPQAIQPQAQPTSQADGHVVQAMQLIAQVMPNLPPNGRARVLRIIEAALGSGVGGLALELLMPG